MCFNLVISFLLIIYGCIEIQGSITATNRILVKLDDEDFHDVKSLLATFNFSLVVKVIPKLYTFKFDKADYTHKVDLQKIKLLSEGQCFHGYQTLLWCCRQHHKSFFRSSIRVVQIWANKIIDIEPVMRHTDKIATNPDATTTEKPSVEDTVTTTPKPHPYLLSPRHGMGVEEAWNAGYTGHGVTIAVIDVGVDIDLPDLAPNINSTLCWNFISKSMDVSPERFHDYPESLALTDHGNRCSGLIASRKENTTCSVGIAFNAKLSVLKPYSVRPYIWGKERTNLEYEDDDIVAALNANSTEIDIYSSSWTSSSSVFTIHESLLNGIKYGRAKKGSIYVFPADKLAYANSMYSIAVNSLSPSGGYPENFGEDCACTLTSAYGLGTQKHINYMVTSSHGNVWTNCTMEFMGTSASTAMVSAMIGLALQAKPNLTWRDVQHIIVRASNHSGLKESSNFRRNAAGFYYHKRFGFGLINASKLVIIAETWHNVGPQRIQTEHSTNLRRHPVRTKNRLTDTIETDIRCQHSDHMCCVSKVEHVIANISYVSPNETNLQMYVQSPAGTKSLLVDRGQAKSQTKRDSGVINIELMSVNFWGEDAVGIWKVVAIQFKDQSGRTTTWSEGFELSYAMLKITGTEHDAYQHNPDSVENEVNQLPCFYMLKNYASIGDLGNHLVIHSRTFKTPHTYFAIILFCKVVAIIWMFYLCIYVIVIILSECLSEKAPIKVADIV